MLTIKHNKSTTRSETLYIAAGVWPNFHGESDLMNIKPLVCLEFPHNVQLNPIRMIITTHLALFFVGCRYLNDFSGVPKTFLFREKLFSNPPKKQSRFFSWRRVDFTISILSILHHDHQMFNHYFAWCSVLILFSMFSFPNHSIDSQHFSMFCVQNLPRFPNHPTFPAHPGLVLPHPTSFQRWFPSIPAHSPDSAGRSDHTHRHSPGSRPGCCHWSGWTPASTAFRHSSHWRGPRANRNPWAACRWWVFLSHFGLLFIIFDMNLNHLSFFFLVAKQTGQPEKSFKLIENITLTYFDDVDVYFRHFDFHWYLAACYMLMQVLWMKVSFPKWWMRCKEWKKNLFLCLFMRFLVWNISNPGNFIIEFSSSCLRGSPSNEFVHKWSVYRMKCSHSNGKRMQKVIFIYLT